MNTSALLVGLEQLLTPYHTPYYVTAADEIMEKVQLQVFPTAVITNTRNSKHIGEHWVAFYIISPTQTEWFCSFGSALWDYPEIKFPTHAIKIIKQNCFALQSETTNTCGLWAMRFISERAQGHSFEKFLSSFGCNRGYNDWKLMQWSKKTFEFYTPAKIYDKSVTIRYV